MKTSYLPGLVAGAICWSLAFTSARAQAVNSPAPATASPLSLPPPPPPPPPPPRAYVSPGRINSAPQPPPIRPQFYRATTLSIWNSEAQMNDFYVNKFIQSAGFGAARMTVPTMTIDPNMRLVLRQDVSLDGPKITAVETYKIDSLELIGIAKHDTPVAIIVNRHSPFLINQGRQTTPSRWSAQQTVSGTRPLTDFEKSALAAIAAGQDVVDQPAENNARLVVGAVRAQQACIECHTGYKVGDALGALTYRLTPSALPMPAVQSAGTANPDLTNPPGWRGGF